MTKAPGTDMSFYFQPDCWRDCKLWTRHVESARRTRLPSTLCAPTPVDPIPTVRRWLGKSPGAPTLSHSASSVPNHFPTTVVTWRRKILKIKKVLSRCVLGTQHASVSGPPIQNTWVETPDPLVFKSPEHTHILLSLSLSYNKQRWHLRLSRLSTMMAVFYIELQRMEEAS